MKKILFILASIFVLTSCSQNSSPSKRPTIITGVVKKISLTAGKRQWFRVTIQDLRGVSHEYTTRDLSYNIGDTIQTGIGD